VGVWKAENATFSTTKRSAEAPHLGNVAIALGTTTIPGQPLMLGSRACVAGNFGDSKPIGEGAAENRIHIGCGYRIYYGIDGENVVLLCAGDKSTQDRDVATARKYWKDYKKRERERKGFEREKEALKNVGLQKRSSKRPKK